MSTTNTLDLNNRIDALEKISHNVEPIQQQIDELKAWTDSGTKDASGNPIILTDGAAFNAEGLAVTCNPKQNLHGYEHPWAGGAGKNKLPMVLADIKSANTDGTWNGNVYTLNGVTFTVLTDDGDNVTGIKVNGTATGGNASLTVNPFTYLVSGSSYVMNGCPTGGDESTYSLLVGDGSARVASDYGNGSQTFTIGERSVQAVIRVMSGKTVNNLTFYPMIRLASVSDATFAPYSNECPITGLTECVVDVKDEDETTHDTATITFGQTVYGGSVDFKTGKVTHASIASYNGETINEPWLSSIDEYVSGTTPTTGAQVVYPLTTPTELTLTPAELELIKGYNYITTNGDNIELTYQPDNLKADILLTVSQLYGSKISIFDGILAGGDTGQVLTKTSDDNYDATWETLPATRTTTKKSGK